MNTYAKLANDVVIAKTIAALKQNGIGAEVVDTKEAAKEKVLSLIPKKAEVMTMSSVSLETLGLVTEFNESGKYDSTKVKLSKMDRKTQGNEMRKLGASPDWAVGSVHAVTQDGQVLIASNTGSQLPGYAYGAGHVVWVVGAQKIVSSMEDGLKRIYEYVVPLEEKHMQQLYGVHTNVSKLLIVNKELVPDRLRVIFVKEPLGF